MRRTFVVFFNAGMYGCEHHVIVLSEKDLEETTGIDSLEKLAEIKAMNATELDLTRVISDTVTELILHESMVIKGGP